MLDSHLTVNIHISFTLSRCSHTRTFGAEFRKAVDRFARLHIIDGHPLAVALYIPRGVIQHLVIVHTGYPFVSLSTYLPTRLRLRASLDYVIISRCVALVIAIDCRRAQSRPWRSR